jgi:hypothetical protein
MMHDRYGPVNVICAVCPNSLCLHYVRTQVLTSFGADDLGERGSYPAARGRSPSSTKATTKSET